MNLGYSGTVAGYRQFGRPEVLKAALSGRTVAQDAPKIQRQLTRAAGQDKVRRTLGYARGGTA